MPIISRAKIFHLEYDLGNSNRIIGHCDIINTLQADTESYVVVKKNSSFNRGDSVFLGSQIPVNIT